MSDLEQDSSSPDVKEKEEVYNEEEDLEKLINEVSQQYEHSPSVQSGDHVVSSHDQENVFSPIESPEDNTTLPDGNETTEDNLHPLNNEEEESSRKRPLSQDEDEETEVQEKRPRIDKNDNEEDGTEVTQETLSETKEDSGELTELQENKSNTAEEEKSDDETELPQLLVDEENEENEESDVDEELELELANLQKEGGQVLPEADKEEKKKDESSDSEVEDGGKKQIDVSDFDLMMQRRKEAMARARRRRRKDIDISSVDDHIHAMIQQMNQAAEEDRRLNLQKKPAIKKISMLPTIISQLKKVDLLSSFIESGICSALSDWLKPLPDHSLPHLSIRESILDILFTFPEMDSHLLKTSGLGKAVMLLYRHPKEVKKNRQKAGVLISNWSRPIFGLTSDYKSLSRDEREERDWAHLSQIARRRLSSSEGKSSQTTQDEPEPQKPGDKGWVGRARVPMPSHKDYVVRPKWNVQQEMKKTSSKKVLNRYEKQLQKRKDKLSRSQNTHAVAISIEGRKMPL